MADYRKMVGEYLEYARKQGYAMGRDDCLTFVVEWINRIDPGAVALPPYENPAEITRWAQGEFKWHHDRTPPDALGCLQRGLKYRLHGRWRPIAPALYPDEKIRAGDVVLFSGASDLMVKIGEQSVKTVDSTGERSGNLNIGLAIGAATAGHIAHRVHQGIAVFEPGWDEIRQIYRFKGE